MGWAINISIISAFRISKKQFMNLLFVLLQGVNMGAEAATDSLDTAATSIDISIFDLLMEGGWYIMIPLALLSIAAIYIFIERTLAVTKALKEEKDFMNKIKDYINEGNLIAQRTYVLQAIRQWLECWKKELAELVSLCKTFVWQLRTLESLRSTC